MAAKKKALQSSALKLRLDELLVVKGITESKDLAQRYILAGQVIVNEHKQTSVGLMVPKDATIRLKGIKAFVGRGGEKLAGALDAFKLTINNRICLDIGVATGGFSDCLFKQGARFILGIDVGYGQLALKLRKDSRMCLMEKTDAKKLTYESINNKLKTEQNTICVADFQLCVMDVSFTSVVPILNHLKKLFEHITHWIILIKPQFEATKTEIEAGGIVTKTSTHEHILKRCQKQLEALDFIVKAQHYSTIKGSKKRNQEVFFLLENAKKT